MGSGLGLMLKFVLILLVLASLTLMELAFLEISDAADAHTSLRPSRSKARALMKDPKPPKVSAPQGPDLIEEAITELDSVLLLSRKGAPKPCKRRKKAKTKASVVAADESEDTVGDESDDGPSDGDDESETTTEGTAGDAEEEDNEEEEGGEEEEEEGATEETEGDTPDEDEEGAEVNDGGDEGDDARESDAEQEGEGGDDEGEDGDEEEDDPDCIDVNGADGGLNGLDSNLDDDADETGASRVDEFFVTPMLSSAEMFASLNLDMWAADGSELFDLDVTVDDVEKLFDDDSKGDKKKKKKKKGKFSVDTAARDASDFLPPPAEMVKYVTALRERTYSHVSQKSNLDFGLKQLGYRQATKGGRKSPVWLAYGGQACPTFSRGEPTLSACMHFMPAWREQDQYSLLKTFQTANPWSNIELPVASWFPLTWRLYREVERRALKTRTTDETLDTEGGPYVIKYTYAHGAGEPLLTAKMWDRLKTAEHSLKLQVKEAKQKLVAQKYINNPYLYEGRKFIIRTWAVIVSANPLIVFYQDGVQVCPPPQPPPLRPA